MGDQLIAIQTKGYERPSYKELRGSLPKSVPLDFGLEKTFAS